MRQRFSIGIRGGEQSLSETALSRPRRAAKGPPSGFRRNRQLHHRHSKQALGNRRNRDQRSQREFFLAEKPGPASHLPRAAGSTARSIEGGIRTRGSNGSEVSDLFTTSADECAPRAQRLPGEQASRVPPWVGGSLTAKYPMLITTWNGEPQSVHRSSSSEDGKRGKSNNE